MKLDEHIQQLTTTSLSDTEAYRTACQRACADDAAFATFRSDPDYTRILEHVLPQLGQQYLDEIRKLAPKFDFGPFRENDQIGGPRQAVYSGIGRISPTTLRYVKVGLEMEMLFGDLNDKRIVEVGGGYGGQARVLKIMFPKCDYGIIDLQAPCRLAARWLLACGVREKLSFDYAENIEYMDRYPDADVFVSNYALTECSPVLVQQYIEKSAIRCGYGYITGNAQRELLEKLLADKQPRFSFEHPVPVEFCDNFLCVW